MFNVDAFFVCVASVSGIFSLFIIVSWLDTPFCHLQGTLVGIMVALCLLISISNKLLEYALNLQEVHTSTTYTHSKIAKSALGFNMFRVHEFLRLL
jgi:hypothetical protein